MARIQAAQAPLREVLHWLERPTLGVYATPHKVVKAWGALRRRLSRLCALGLEYTDLELGATQDRVSLLEPLRRLHTTLGECHACSAHAVQQLGLASMARAGLWAEDKERLREWHA